MKNILFAGLILHHSSVPIFWLQVTGCRLQVAGYRLQVAGQPLQPATCNLQPDSSLLIGNKNGRKMRLSIWPIFITPGLVPSEQLHIKAAVCRKMDIHRAPRQFFVPDHVKQVFLDLVVG
jgi:hypothetical protein